MDSIANCAVGIRPSIVGIRPSLEMGDFGALCASEARNTQPAYTIR